MSKTREKSVEDRQADTGEFLPGRIPGAKSPGTAGAGRQDRQPLPETPDLGGGACRGRAGLPESPKPVFLPRDIGWLLVAGGVIGIAAPGVLGVDMLALGTLILWPGNRHRLARWLACHQSAPRFLRGSMKQIERFLHDLEARYPRGGNG